MKIHESEGKRLVVIPCAEIGRQRKQEPSFPQEDPRVRREAMDRELAAHDVVNGKLPRWYDLHFIVNVNDPKNMHSAKYSVRHVRQLLDSFASEIQLLALLPALSTSRQRSLSVDPKVAASTPTTPCTRCDELRMRVLSIRVFQWF